jgi:hypothetical protein
MNRLLPLSATLLLVANGSSQLHKMYQSQCKANNSWWWAEGPPEIWRVVIPIKLEFSASVGFIHKESVTKHGHTIVKDRPVYESMIYELFFLRFNNNFSKKFKVSSVGLQYMKLILIQKTFIFGVMPISNSLFHKLLYLTENRPLGIWGWHIWTFRSSELFCLTDWYIAFIFRVKLSKLEPEGWRQYEVSKCRSTRRNNHLDLSCQYINFLR